MRQKIREETGKMIRNEYIPNVDYLSKFKRDFVLYEGVQCFKNGTPYKAYSNIFEKDA